MGLNARQRLFVKEYTKDKNATRAYRAAGYPGKGAEASASKLLRNPNVAQAVDRELKKQADKADISAERTIKRIADIAYHMKHARNSDVLKACELLGKHFKLFTDVLEHQGKGGGPIAFIALPPNGSESTEHPSPADLGPEKPDAGN